MNIVLLLLKYNLLSINFMTPLLWKTTLLHLHIIPVITKGGKKVIIIMMIFNGKVSTALWFSIQLILLTLEELFTYPLPLNIHQ